MSISEQEIIAYAMENEYLAGLLSLPDKPTYINDIIYVDVMPMYDSELPFAIHLAFRNTILPNHEKHNITPHEVLVGGSKRGLDGKKKIISDYVTKDAIDNSAYGADGDAWGLVLGAWHHGLCRENPYTNQGGTTSSVENITDVDVNRISLSMTTWLPDFEYFDFLKEHGEGDKYNPQNFDLAYEFLNL